MVESPAVGLFYSSAKEWEKQAFRQKMFFSCAHLTAQNGWHIINVFKIHSKSAMQRKRLETSQESRRQVRADGATRSLRLEAVGDEPDGTARYSGDELHCCM